MINSVTVEARIRLKPSSEGGRRQPITTAYRPNHVFEYKNDGQLLRTYVGEIQIEEGDKIYPGEEKVVSVMFLLDGGIGKYLETGGTWWIHEGARVVGEAEILSL